MSTAKAIGGGLLHGLGQGMIRQDEVRREEAERLRQEALERVRRQEDRDFQTERDEANREHQSSLIRSTVVGEDGTVRGVTGTGAVDLGFKAQPKDRKGLLGGGGMSAEEKRIWDQAVQRETSKNSDGVDETNWEGVTKRLRQQGHERLAELAAPMEGENSGIDVNSAEYREAARRADEWVDSEAGWLSGDSSDFEKYGGNREQARQAKTLEFYREITGQGGQPGAPQPGAEPTSPPAGAEAKTVEGVQGTGTQQDPYQPTTQEQFDQLPTGAIYRNPADGKLYRKN